MKDVVPFDKNRVVLQSQEDYINASYIEGLIPDDIYIATQGPLQHTVSDFWQMTWEQNTRLIIMLTSEEEKLRVKCHLYWPLKDTPLIIDTLGIHVYLVSEELILKSTDTILRVLRLTRNKEERIVYHVQYKGINDYK